jgi:chemotaxis protein MotB
MSDDQNKRPIIIKKKKGGDGHGHHGGAWKVAYADFVTAMMAFFMLMWLLNATTEKQRKGLADYFSPTVPVSRSSGGGDGVAGGETLTVSDATVGSGTGGLTTTQLQGFGEGTPELEEVAEAILGRGGDSVIEEQQRRNVTVRLTDKGLIIELFSVPGSPLFDGERPTDTLRGLVRSVAGELEKVDNEFTIESHVARAPLVRQDIPTWDLSMGRVEAVRDILLRLDLVEDRLRRMTGHGDRVPVVRPTVDIRNDRIEIILLREDA